MRDGGWLGKGGGGGGVGERLCYCDGHFLRKGGRGGGGGGRWGRGDGGMERRWLGCGIWSFRSLGLYLVI